MPINYDKLLALKIPEVTQTYTEKDAILYALGVGLGRDPMDADELPFVYEKNLKLLPTFAAVLGWPGFWVRDLDTGIDWVKVVAGEQGLVLHRPLAPRGTVIGRTRVTEIIDKGAGKGAHVYSAARADRRRKRREDRHRDADHGLPRRRRLRRAAARGAGGASDPGARARSRLRSANAAGGRADLSAERRSQSVACRSRRRAGRRAFRVRSCMGSRASASPCHGILQMSLRS